VKDGPLRIVALTESYDHVCCRYRLRAFVPFLESVGHSFSFQTFPISFSQKLFVSRLTRGADLVIVQRKLLSLPELYLLRRSAKALIFDLDDAVWLRDSWAKKGFSSTRRRNRFRGIVRRADMVTAGNPWLADCAVRWKGLPHAVVVPTCVDLSEYRNPVDQFMDRVDRFSPSRTGADLVWIGSSSTLQGLEHISPLLETLGETIPGLKLRLICDRSIRLGSLPVVSLPWTAATEARDLADSDIGISWIPDDPWSLGKCGLKILQYMAAGLPVVANPVGVHPEMVLHGVTGFLASTTEEWIEAVRTLAADPELRRRMGLAGRERVEALYSVEAGAKIWLKLLDRVQHEILDRSAS